jgi:hypothetical protein
MPTKTAAKPKRQSKGKRHHVHADSLQRIADDLKAKVADPQVDTSTPTALAGVIVGVFHTEAKRVGGILR